MSKPSTTYTATFTDGTTATKSSKSAKGFSHAVQIATTDGNRAVSFSASPAGIQRVIKDWRDAGELESYEIATATS